MLPKLTAALHAAYLGALLNGYRLEAGAWALAHAEAVRRVAMYRGLPYAPIGLLGSAERTRYRRLAEQAAPLGRGRARRKRR